MASCSMSIQERMSNCSIQAYVEFTAHQRSTFELAVEDMVSHGMEPREIVAQSALRAYQSFKVATEVQKRIEILPLKHMPEAQAAAARVMEGWSAIWEACFALADRWKVLNDADESAESKQVAMFAHMWAEGADKAAELVEIAAQEVEAYPVPEGPFSSRSGSPSSMGGSLRGLSPTSSVVAGNDRQENIPPSTEPTTANSVGVGARPPEAPQPDPSVGVTPPASNPTGNIAPASETPEARPPVGMNPSSSNSISRTWLQRFLGFMARIGSAIRQCVLSIWAFLRRLMGR